MPTISIIDDDDEVRAAMESLIQSHGLEVMSFASAEDFLNSAALDQTACLITDVHMPGMSGVDLQDILLKRGSTIPMIFITAYPEERLQGRVVAAGALGFLPKPFNAFRLMACVEKALNGSHHADSPEAAPRRS